MIVTFLYLDAFSSIGGIQNFNKYFMKALNDIKSTVDLEFYAYSLYDKDNDERYIKDENFCGFNANKIEFSVRSIIKSLRADIIILGHINLYPLGLFLNLIGKKIIVIGHGIDVWEDINILQRKLLQYSDLILAVSEYTKNKLIKLHKVSPDHIKIFPNTFDPFLKLPKTFDKPKSLINKYNVKQNEKIIITVSRLSSNDRYKGYDRVIEIMPELLREMPNTRYIIIGGGDQDEIERIKKLIIDLKLTNNIILTGYVTEEELFKYYQLADLFIMPSKKEGFGIVYLEALLHGLPVIAGNCDGSAEPLLNGELGTLVDPDDSYDIKEKLTNVLKKSVNDKHLNQKYVQQKTSETYGFERYKNNLIQLIT